MKNASIKILALVAATALIATGCTPQARKARHLAKADKFFAADQYPQAEVEYLNVAKLDPNDAHTAARLGQIYFDEGRTVRAYQFLAKAKALEPDNLQVRSKLGFLSLSVGSTKEARDEALAILEKDPNFPEAAFLLAETGRTPKDAEAVRQRLDKLVQQTGVTAGTEIGYGTLDFLAANFPSAEQHYSRAQALETNSVGAHYALGILYWTMNDTTNADRALLKAAENSPSRSIQRLGYADFKMKTGNPEEAKRLLGEMVKKTPDFMPAWISLAEVSLSQGRFEDCAAILNQIQVRDPENYQSQLLGARMKLLKAQTDPAQIDQAIADYERLAARFKNSPQVFFQLGVAYLAKGDNSKALKNFTEAVALDPNFEDALIQQAQLNVQRDDPDKAIAPLIQLIKRRPQLPMPYLVLAGA